MKQFSRLLAGVVVATIMVAGATATMAQDKAKEAQVAPAGTLNPGVKLLFENAKVRVVEFRIKPGITAPSVERGDRVIHDVRGGTLLLTYPDGKTEKRVIKAGNTRWVEKATFGFKNVGKTEVVQIVVFPK